MSSGPIPAFGGFNGDQIRFLAMIMKHSKTMPKNEEIDWEGVAKDMEHMSASAAQQRYMCFQLCTGVGHNKESITAAPFPFHSVQGELQERAVDLSSPSAVNFGESQEGTATSSSPLIIKSDGLQDGAAAPSSFIANHGELQDGLAGPSSQFTINHNELRNGAVSPQSPFTINFDELQEDTAVLSPFTADQDELQERAADTSSPLIFRPLQLKGTQAPSLLQKLQLCSELQHRIQLFREISTQEIALLQDFVMETGKAPLCISKELMAHGLTLLD
ncbi:hypothetical protein M406DRAFT_327173 [Cryphonectria parasitica EP155]|uniref:Myb-like DNA-binding domain-containing protein n=1 Tax=Cryphonectria parasitica (strain ATCC 38755 / EP155) TaxID=660469 RepID=A0A9P5CT37_CRYP1|nr:uncharacterized protein M406DRAFT_327173 [Cryphonectria parasitica EP155]KAF3768755.1 hypothetical protein M406DRAFT_327173 [Cryphonectria parasitica EP155]